MEEKEMKKDQTEAESQNKDQAGDSSAAKSPVTDQKDIEENQLVAYLSYLGILFLIPLFLKKESEFCKFHAKQGLVIFLGWMVGWVTMPLLGLGVLVQLVMIVLSIMGLIQVYKKEMNPLPIVGDFSKKFNI